MEIKLTKSIRMQTQVIKLHEQKVSIRRIAKALKIHRKTVRKILRANGVIESKKKSDTQEPQPENKLNEFTSEKPKNWRNVLDWDYVLKEVHIRGTPAKLLYFELNPKTSLSSFWREIKKRSNKVDESKITIKLHHNPAEKTFIDFADGIDIVDRKSGKKQKTQLFCGALAFSSYTFAEFVLDQKLFTFIEVQTRMWGFFGGVTPYVVPDNLKSAVTRADLYDPDNNATYVEFANHYNFAVLPARPSKPKDKAAVESAVGVVERGFYKEVRDRIFYSLEELNSALREYLHRLNHSVMKDHGVTRHDRYLTEKETLKVLPVTRYEKAQWREAKVHPDCHIQVEKNFYSVPYVYVGTHLRVRITSKLIEIFDDDLNQIAVHVKVKGQFKYSTIDAHYPEQKLGVARFEVSQAKAWALRIGENTRKLVDELIDSSEYPLRYLRRVQGVLRLAKLYPNPSIEFACKQALLFKKYRLQYIRDCAKNHHINGNKPKIVSAAPVREVTQIHLHGVLD